jgi:Trk-type K+ transport system membrane component
MANFNTHLSSAAVVSGLLSTLCLQVGFVNSDNAMILILVGTIGGILPDIDLHYSYPSRIIFSVLGIIAALFWVVSEENSRSVVELWLVGLAIYLLTRYGIWRIFNIYTKHRGAIHSIAAAALSGLATTAISYQIFEKSDFLSWLMGFFMFSGFILHLLLDELYSVDFMNRRIKRSFGTALKVVDSKQPYSSGLIVALSLAIWFATPSAILFVDTLLSGETYSLIWHRMLPDNLPF